MVVSVIDLAAKPTLAVMAKQNVTDQTNQPVNAALRCSVRHAQGDQQKQATHLRQQRQQREP
jgi:hypothetical protein